MFLPVGDGSPVPFFAAYSFFGGTGNPSPTIGNVVGWLKYRTTKTINQECGVPGAKFWQRSYYDHVIRNEQDYIETIRYIENNPIAFLEKHCRGRVSRPDRKTTDR